MQHHVILIASLAVLGVVAAGQAAPSQEPEWKVPSRAARKKNPLPADASIIEQGKAVFTVQCVSCHGASGIGDGVAAKDLEKHPGDLTSEKVQEQKDGALFWKITTGRAPMTAFGDTLTVQERWQVVRYIRTLTGGPTVEVPELEAPERLRTALTKLQEAYDALRSSLARDDQEEATKSLPALDAALEALEEVDQDKLGEELTKAWKRSLDDLQQAMSGLREAKGVKGMRVAFAALSAASEEAWARFGHTLESPLYVFECSKATEDGAARWVQITREADNPYLGSKEGSGAKLVKGIAAIRPKDDKGGDSK